MNLMSIVVCTYNSCEKDIKFTLDSIINQEYKKYEIIVCDDGSQNNNEKFLKDYFISKGYSNYKLVLNEINKGTIKNLMSGIDVSDGKYIKPIGAGDAFATTDAIESVITTMEKGEIKYLFTDMICFSWQDKKIKPRHLSMPLLKKSFVNGVSTEKTIENVVVYNDQICGASVFYETDYLKGMLLQIQDKVIYMEDLVQYIVLLSSDKIHYMDEKLILYEIGAGISTLKNSQNNTRMIKDKNAFLQIIFEDYKYNKYIIRRRRLEDINTKRRNKIIRVINKSICEPGWFLLKLKRWIESKR